MNLIYPEITNFRQYKNTSVIYGIMNIKNNYIYVGSAVSLYTRIKMHLIGLKNNKHYNKKLQNAWNKYGKENFRITILSIVDDVSFIKNFEQIFINFYQSYKRKSGYNICPNAHSIAGSKRSKKAIIQTANWHRGRKRSKESVENIRQAARNRSSPFICYQNKKIYYSTGDAARELGLRSYEIRSCLIDPIRHRMIKRKYSFCFIKDIDKAVPERKPRSKEAIKKAIKAAALKKRNNTICKMQDVLNLRKCNLPLICNQTQKMYRNTEDAGRQLNIYSRGIWQNVVNKSKTVHSLTFTYCRDLNYQI